MVISTSHTFPISNSNPKQYHHSFFTNPNVLKFKPCMVSVKPPPPDFDFRTEYLIDSRAVIAETHPELLDLADNGSLVLITKTQFGPVPVWRTEFVEPELIWLIGTNHVSSQSAVDVERVVRTVKPDNVVVELCRSRAGVMYTSNDEESGPKLKSNMFSLSGAGFFGAVGRSINLGGQTALALRLLLAVLSSKVSSDVDRPFGDEFRVARRTSEEVGAQIVLGDRPIEITLERAWSSLKLNEKLSLVVSVVRGITATSELSRNTLKESSSDNSNFQLYEQLSFSFPSLLQPLIHERDTYIAWSLKRSKAVNGSKKVVGVIGKGHMNGVIYALVSDSGDLRFRDLVGQRTSSGNATGGWLNTLVKNLNGIRILLVDDDSTCLAIIAAILRKWKYEVMTVKHGVEALCMLRMRPYDLVVADVHMPDMNGFQLHHHIKKEFQLPVVLISADDKEEVACKGMANGAAHFLVKPFKSDDLRNLWQFSVWWQKFKNPAILLEIGLITRNQYDNLMPADRPSRRRRQNNNNYAAGHIATSSAATDVPDTPKASRTRKLVWTRTLHTRFVEAIIIIGYHRAVPTTILEVMNAPGLTREQVASHLQKYRRFLRRVLDGRTDIECSDYYSSHVSGNPNLLLLEQLRDNVENGDLANPIQQQGDNVPVPGTSSIMNPPASTTEFTPSGFKALPPIFTEGASTSGTKNTMTEMLMQQAPMSTKGNTLVIGSSTATNCGSLSNVDAGDLDGVTFPYANTGHVGSSSSVPRVGQNLNCFDVPNNEMTKHNQTSAAQQNYYSGGLSGSNNVFTSINHVGPSSAPFTTSFYSQQPFNADEQSNMFFGGINIPSFGDQLNYVQQILNVGSPFGDNQFGVSSAINVNEQVDDFGSIRFAPADNYLPGFNPNLNLNPNLNQVNQDENEEGEDSFWSNMVDVGYRGFHQVNDDSQNNANNHADVAADAGDEEL